MSTALTFTHALERAELAARQTLPAALHERLAAAYSLVKDGRVFQASDGSWQVDSATSEGLTYSVNGSCTCDDHHYKKPAYCKHQLAMHLARKVKALMTVQAAVGQAAQTAQEPASASQTTVDTSAAACAPQGLGEAPASVNCHIVLEGRQVQLTLRDTDETRLLARLAAVLRQYPAPAKFATQGPTPGQDKGWCHKHNVPMKHTTKDGRSWYSHYDQNVGRWCKGR
jgi:hypothetical protein